MAKDLGRSLQEVELHDTAREILAENSSNRDALAVIRRVDSANARPGPAAPKLGAAMRKPVTLEFRDASVRSVFELLSRNSGLNFIFDRDVPADLKTTVFVRDTTVEDVIRFVLVTSQLESKVLNENTILIYPNTPAKAQNYKDLVVRNFYLENADVKRTADMIKALVKTRDMFVDEKLNLIVMRDTPEAVRMAERLVANQDLAEPEVMLEVEVLEVAANLQNQIGIQWPSQLGVGVVGAAGTPGTITLPEWLNRNAGLVRLTVSDPLFLLSLRKQDGSTNILANPRIRVKNREKARVHIGDKVPVITTTTTATGFVAESVNYLDVGLKLEVEPNVYLENDVGIRIGLEVSSITGTERSPSGTQTYRVGTRNANTVLRLRDGETQVLAGLISDEDRRTATKVPGLGDAPVVGRLFSSNNDIKSKTEIMLLITPRVVRNISRPGGLEEYFSGTDASVGAAPLNLSPAPVTAPAPMGGPSGPSGPSGQAGQAGQSANGSGPGTGARFSLQAPPQVQAGQEFTVQLNMDSEAPLRNGTLGLSYDSKQLIFVRAEPGELLPPPSPGTSFNVTAPENAGRISLSFVSNADIKGKGTAARVVFRASDTAGGTIPQSVRINTDSLSVIGANARVQTVQLPAPVAVNIIR